MENSADRIEDADNTNATAITFDNLTILKEFGNIANLVRETDFLETVPKAKLRRLKWVQMFNCLKQGILDDMVHELNVMWEYEDMPQKLEILDKQKEKFAENDKQLWRPQLADVGAQLKAHEVANLQKQKKLLESLAKEYEVRVNRLKKTVSARRGYLKALQLDIQKYQKKNEDIIQKISEKFQSHSSIVETIAPEVDIESVDWSDKMMEVDSERDRT
ncbi:hypothetical protein JYU34_013545 [Plutella xylostella]|uniref:Uncharacterized protein n=1 Tax=Plutella xylostella TaxID=51655 RepID=A0ABQ7QBD6_PLUXY|nr:hypothetical protein JYU34_013545 [Plutella xylostella]